MAWNSNAGYRTDNTDIPVGLNNYGTNYTRDINDSVASTPATTGVTSQSGMTPGLANVIGGGINAIGGVIGGVNDYGIEEVGVPFQVEDSLSRREKEKMQKKVDLYNQEWKSRQEAMRVSIEDQKEKAHAYRLEADAIDTADMEMSDRFSSAMRRLNKSASNNVKLSETADNIFASAREDNTLKDYITQKWGS